MRRAMIAMLSIIPLLSCAHSVRAEDVALSGILNQEQQVIYLRTLLAKLRETAVTAQDVTSLESLGIPPREAARLQTAMNLRNRQLMDEAMRLIRKK